MRNAHFVAKHHLSFITYKLLCKLDKQKGLDVGDTYVTDKAGAQFVESIASVTRSELLQNIDECKYFSFTCDGSTDFTGEDMESIYIRTAIKGNIKDTFMSIGSAELASSADIYNFVIDSFASLKLQDHMKNKLNGFCSDGASNMLGSKSGLAALLRKDWPHLFVTHCLAHRLELAFKDAIKKSSPKLYEKATTLLLGLFFFYRKSPKQKKALLRAFECMGIKKLIPTIIGGTRWLPHYDKALQVFFKTYSVLKSQLDTASHENAKAEGLAKLMMDGHVWLHLLFLKRILSPLVKLSLFLQKEGISLADAYSRVNATKIIIEQIDVKDDKVIATVISQDTYADQRLTFKGKKSVDHSSLINSLIAAIDVRFPYDEVVAATEITSFNNWPEESSDEKTDYGDDHIQCLFLKFEKCLPAEKEVSDYLEEWNMLKSLVYDEFSKQLTNKQLTWTQVFRGLTEQGLENVFQLIELVLALPPTSVRNESTFSAMKLLKSKRRGKMAASRLNDLLTVNLQAPSIEAFNPEPAINHWMVSTPSGRPRRVVEKNRPTVTPTIVNLVEKEHVEGEVEQVQQEASTSKADSEYTSEEDDEEDVLVEVTEKWDDDEDDDYGDMEMSEDNVFFMLNMYRD